MFRGFFNTPLHIGTNSCGRCIENSDFVFFNDFPHAIIRWIVGNTFVHHLRCTVTKWPVHDVAVTSNPANISRAPENILLWVEVEYILMCVRDMREVTTGGVHDAFGLTCSS